MNGGTHGQKDDDKTHRFFSGRKMPWDFSYKTLKYTITRASSKN